MNRSNSPHPDHWTEEEKAEAASEDFRNRTPDSGLSKFELEDHPEEVARNNAKADAAVLHTMKRHGGSFARALADAGLRADADNLARLKAAWPELWTKYLAVAEHGPAF